MDNRMFRQEKRTKLQEFGDIPFVGIIMLLIMLANYVLNAALFLMWLLRILQVKSVFNQWADPYSSWQIFWTLIAVTIYAIAFRKIIGKII